MIFNLRIIHEFTNKILPIFSKNLIRLNILILSENKLLISVREHIKLLNKHYQQTNEKHFIYL